VSAELSRLMQLRRSVRLAGGTVTGFRVRSMPSGAASLGVDRDHLLLGTLNGVAKNVEFSICRPVSSLSHHRKFAASSKNQAMSMCCKYAVHRFNGTALAGTSARWAWIPKRKRPLRKSAARSCNRTRGGGGCSSISIWQLNA